MACTLTTTLPTRGRVAPRLTLRSRRAPLRCVAGDLDITYRQAADAADLRASASVRALSFHVYDKDRNEYVLRTHRKMKLDQEWAALQRKMSASEPGYEVNKINPAGIKVTVLLATIPVPEDSELEEKVSQGLDPSCRIPADDDRPVTMCIGTLDINVCERFTSEELHPLTMSSGDEGRAFISNVAVADGARREGIASKLMEETENWCRENSIKQLFVHVEPSNTAAMNLYTEKMGFAKETEEKAAEAYIRDRERRLLLRKNLE